VWNKSEKRLSSRPQRCRRTGGRSSPPVRIEDQDDPFVCAEGAEPLQETFPRRDCSHVAGNRQPELTIRTISTEGTASTTILARVISSSVGAPKLLPLSTAYPWSILFRILGLFGLNELGICENEKI